jgi:hypothetical protein
VTENKSREIADLPREDLLRLVGLYFGKALVHYGLWFSATVDRHGIETALETESRVLERFGPVALKRLAPHFGIEMEGDIPKALLGKSEEELIGLLQDIAKTWLASDGIWFRNLESQLSMKEAKGVNDFCWNVFGNMEAYKLKRVLREPDRGGLATLEKVLKLRLYSSLNPHEAIWEDDRALVWKMVRCRVQEIRRKKGLPDYPCKSAGVVEYTSVARGVNPLIETECIVCPPDPVPEGIACAWRFTMKS